MAQGQISSQGVWRLLIRYGEVAIKNTISRLRMEKRLVYNIEDALKSNGINSKVWASDARVWVCCFDSEAKAIEAANIVSRVMGVISVSPVITIRFSDINEFIDAAKNFFTPRVKGKTFAVRVHRKGSHSFTSKDVEKLLGKILLECGGRKVDLETPEVKAFIEIRDLNAYLFDKIINGPRGLPIGVEGRVLGLLLNGLFSLAAIWMIMKRGCEADLLLPNVDPIFTERMLSLVKMFSSRWMYGYRPKLYVVDIKPLLNKISSTGQSLSLPLFRRIIMEIAYLIAQETKAEAIISDEFFKPVSPYILSNLTIVDGSITLPILRPLITLDRNEVYRVIERIELNELPLEEYSIYSAIGLKESTEAFSTSDIDSIEKGLHTAIEYIANCIREKKVYDLRSNA